MSAYRSRTGITEAAYLSMLALQGGGCALCANPPKTRRLSVDHDHRTGTVRGLLCHRCNRALPAWMTSEWLALAARYLAGGNEAVYAPRVTCGYCGALDCAEHDDLAGA